MLDLLTFNYKNTCNISHCFRINSEDIKMKPPAICFLLLLALLNKSDSALKHDPFVYSYVPNFKGSDRVKCTTWKIIKIS